MMRKTFASSAIALLIFATSFGQVGIGTTTPDTSSALDITSTDSGLLIPRVALTSTASAGPITSPATALVIYNTATAGAGATAVTPGFYYWNGSWQRFNDGSAGWELDGNAVTASDFIGTTNNFPLNIHVNNNQRFSFTDAGQIIPVNATSSTLIGNSTSASGDFAIAIGELATADFDDAIAIGRRASTGERFAIALGLDASAPGLNSTALGNEASSGGNQSTAVGYQTFASNVNATALGFDARATGNNSTALGYDTDSAGNNTVSIGISASASANNSVAIGSQASSAGSGSLALGFQSSAPNFNSTAIGNGAVATGSNRMRFGNTTVNTIEAQVGISVTSDGRFKYDIEENVPGLSFINALRPVTYKFDLKKLSMFRNEPSIAQNTGKIETGFIAQEVEEAAKKLGYDFSAIDVPKDSDKQNYTLSYAQFVVPLVKAVQEQQEEIEALKKELNELKSIKEEIAQLRAMIQPNDRSTSAVKTEISKKK
ncbi:tail fiber domain-containing protein [Sungkyunkwania multivorans]|uniref:Tail fiber domain-containing protein n=1 Tax=Sungkyunkwania multivorans TaxID=1173618 RepID=A0ABW3CTT3_9FLAO